MPTALDTLREATERIRSWGPQDFAAACARRQLRDEHAMLQHVERYKRAIETLVSNRSRRPTPFDAMCEALREELGEIYRTWFVALNLEGYDGAVLTVSVPVKFFQDWITTCYPHELLAAARAAYGGVQRVDVQVRMIGPAGYGPQKQQGHSLQQQIRELREMLE